MSGRFAEQYCSVRDPAEFARTARTIATEARIQGFNPARASPGNGLSALAQPARQSFGSMSNIEQSRAGERGMLAPSQPSNRLLSAAGGAACSRPFRQEHHMPEANARPEPSLIPILRPRCPTCQGRMMLTCIEPGCNGPDLQTFEC